MSRRRKEGHTFRVNHIAWDTDGIPPSKIRLSDGRRLPVGNKSVLVVVPDEIVACDEEEEYISDWLSEEYEFCHGGFLFKEV